MASMLASTYLCLGGLALGAHAGLAAAWRARASTAARAEGGAVSLVVLPFLALFSLNEQDRTRGHGHML